MDAEQLTLFTEYEATRVEREALVRGALHNSGVAPTDVAGLVLICRELWDAEGSAFPPTLEDLHVRIDRSLATIKRRLAVLVRLEIVKTGRDEGRSAADPLRRVIDWDVVSRLARRPAIVSCQEKSSAQGELTTARPAQGEPTRRLTSAQGEPTTAHGSLSTAQAGACAPHAHAHASDKSMKHAPERDGETGRRGDGESCKQSGPTNASALIAVGNVSGLHVCLAKRVEGWRCDQGMLGDLARGLIEGLVLFEELRRVLDEIEDRYRRKLIHNRGSILRLEINKRWPRVLDPVRRARSVGDVLKRFVVQGA